MEGAVILHETIHELHTKKQNRVIFKIDFKKAYDKVKWNFLQQSLRMKGFDPKWCEWVKCFVEGGNVGIKMNDQVGSYFQTLKRVLGRVIHCLPYSLILLQICWQSLCLEPKSMVK